MWFHVTEGPPVIPSLGTLTPDATSTQPLRCGIPLLNLIPLLPA